MLTVTEAKSRIEKSKLLMYQMKSEIEKYTKLYELSREDFVKTIKDSAPYNLQIYVNSIKECKEYVHSGFTRHKDRKETYEKLCDSLINDLGIEPCLKIKDIEIVGYGDFLYSLIFDFNGKEYKLNIPDVNILTKNNFEYSHEGKATLFIKDDKLWLQIASSYYFEDLKEALQKISKCF